MAGEPAGAAELARRYEDLRAAVLGGTDGGSRHGWAVLARSGMAAWLFAVALVPVPPARRTGQPLAAVGSPVAGELVQVLAQMVLAAAGGGCRDG